MNKSIKTVALAAALLLGTVGGAFAATAYADGEARVKAAPSSSSRTVDRLRDGERVEVEGCSRSYCYVERRGPDGYVRTRDLIFKKPGRGGRDRDEPNVEFCVGGGNFGGGGFGFGKFCVQN